MYLEWHVSIVLLNSWVSFFTDIYINAFGRGYRERILDCRLFQILSASCVFVCSKVSRFCAVYPWCGVVYMLGPSVRLSVYATSWTTLHGQCYISVTVEGIQ